MKKLQIRSQFVALFWRCKFIDIINFDNWKEDVESGKFGSGASEKLWLVNPETNEKGLFKFPKIKSDGTITGEYWAEKLSSMLAKLLEIDCADVDIGIYNRKIRFYEL